MESFLYNTCEDSTFRHQEVDMGNSEKTTGEINANMGVGASIGGAVHAAWLFQACLGVIIAVMLARANGPWTSSSASSNINGKVI
jgi:hypothetical protein